MNFTAARCPFACCSAKMDGQGFCCSGQQLRSVHCLPSSSPKAPTLSSCVQAADLPFHPLSSLYHRTHTSPSRCCGGCQHSRCSNSGIIHHECISMQNRTKQHLQRRLELQRRDRGKKEADRMAAAELHSTRQTDRAAATAGTGNREAAAERQ